MLVERVYDERGRETNACPSPTASITAASIFRVPFRSAPKIVSSEAMML